MFGKKAQEISKEEILNLIAPGTVIEGNLNVESEGINRIDGRLVGNVKGKGSLIIGEKGSVKGDVQVAHVIVYGTVEGNIVAKTLEIKATGKVTGNLQVEELTIERGALFNGECRMNRATSSELSPEQSP
ncbi:bactofilin family protein [Thermocrinis minervae]|uniref:Protein CcmA, bactofilin family n=1 Tax=Thermocrinis minervae TaxID=381751 RepID=A0A1M6SJ35_9AQUI|nr:polymer-forming cytoskeletal protein [Thermocrinis minervae]SHK44761.1 protein CcmA, bactofilin family [Thermocrinis minervae]